MLTKDRAMTAHLLEGNLLSALQIVIATDFSIVRAQTARPATTGSLSLRSSGNASGCTNLREASPFHPVSSATVRFENRRTLDSLLFTPQPSQRDRHQGSGSSNEDVAFTTTRM